MILQSEYDAEVRRKRLRVAVVFFVIFVAVIAIFFAMKAGWGRFVGLKPGANTEAPGTKANPASGQGDRQASDISGTVSGQLTQEEMTAYENAAKEAESVRQQANKGTLSAEEARDRLRDIGSKLPVPPPPPEMKK